MNGNQKFWVFDGDTATSGTIKVKVSLKERPTWTTFKTWYDVEFTVPNGKDEYRVVAGFVSKADAAGYIVGRLGVASTDAVRML